MTVDWDEELRKLNASQYGKRQERDLTKDMNDPEAVKWARKNAKMAQSAVEKSTNQVCRCSRSQAHTGVRCGSANPAGKCCALVRHFFTRWGYNRTCLCMLHGRCLDSSCRVLKSSNPSLPSPPTGGVDNKMCYAERSRQKWTIRPQRNSTVHQQLGVSLGRPADPTPV